MANSNQVFAALADPTRRAILEALGKEGQLAGDIARLFKISWPAVSRHLKVLRSAGLVWESRTGRSRYYEINHQALGPVLGWLSRFRGPEPSIPPPVPAPPMVGREYTS
jgi:DNA-binding transcriptional ArsR family regulator